MALKNNKQHVKLVKKVQKYKKKIQKKVEKIFMAEKKQTLYC